MLPDEEPPRGGGGAWLLPYSGAGSKDAESSLCLTALCWVMCDKQLVSPDEGWKLQALRPTAPKSEISFLTSMEGWCFLFLVG